MKKRRIHTEQYYRERFLKRTTSCAHVGDRVKHGVANEGVKRGVAHPSPALLARSCSEGNLLGHRLAFGSVLIVDFGLKRCLFCSGLRVTLGSSLIPWRASASPHLMMKMSSFIPCGGSCSMIVACGGLLEPHVTNRPTALC